MNFSARTRFLVSAGVVLTAVAALAVPAWYWFVEREEVPPGKFLVLIHLWGRELPEGDIIAPDDSYKGVKLEVKAEGRHFINPLFWRVERHDMVQVQPDACLVLVRRFGKDISRERRDRGDFVSRSDQPGAEEKGVVREVLKEGAYRINPYAYDTKPGQVVKVGADEVGVRVRKVGEDSSELPVKLAVGTYVVPEGYRGVQETPVRPGTYYVNPEVESIIRVEVRSHRVEFDDISFPSRDGFTLKPHVIVEYAVDAAKAPEVFVRLSDNGLLSQADDPPDANPILQKVVLPQIRGFARIEGSNFDANDFILTADAGDPAPKKARPKDGNTLERLKIAIEKQVKPRCADLGIRVKGVSLTSMKLPEELTLLIAERDQARVLQNRNKSMIDSARSNQKLKAQEAETAGALLTTSAETRLQQAQILAKQRKEVEQQRLEQELVNAQLKLEAAKKQAEAIKSKGEAEAAVLTAQNEAEVAGLRKAVQGFTSVQSFAQFHVLAKLGPALTDIFASDDGDFAKLLSGYLSAPTAVNKQAVAAPATAP